jgi:hypothetical protein
MGQRLMGIDGIRKGRRSMFAKTIKWGAIAALIIGAFLHSTGEYALFLQFVVVTASIFVLAQAATMRRYVWMALFLVVACAFNPVFAVPFSNYNFGIASAFATLLFFFSLELLNPKSRLSVASTTDPVPGRELL